MDPFVAFIGIDWADQEHAVCLVDPKSSRCELSTLDQTPEAIDDWVTKLRKRFPAGNVAVCLEQSRGALLYALMKYEFLVLFPINPSQLSSYREALGPSGAKDDPTDARLLAEFLQKHGERLKGWKPDDAQTRLLRALVEDRRNLVKAGTALSNRLISRLKQYFPLALEMVEPSSRLGCAFLSRWGKFDQLRAATEQELRDFYQQHHCRHPASLTQRIEAWHKALPLTSDPAVVESGALQIGVLVRQLADLHDAIDRYDAEIKNLMDIHPDGRIFQSFPAAGAAMAPRLLTAFGSDRDRVENAAQMQQQAGVAPVTTRSGKSHVVNRRWACNKFLLQTFHEYAGHSLKSKDCCWAKAYYQMLRDRGTKHHAAVRALAFKWIRILYHCWKTHTYYDETVYMQSLIKRKSAVISHLAAATE